MSLTLRRRGKSVLLSLKLESAEQTQRTVWSAASSKTGPGRGHLFSADPEARGRGDPLGERTVTEHLLPLTGAARQLLPALPLLPSLPPSPGTASLPPLPCPARSSEPVGTGAREARPKKCFCSGWSCCWAESGEAMPRSTPLRQEAAPAQPRRAPPASRGSSGPPVLLERAGGKKLQDELSGGGMALDRKSVV